jgi:predicted GNAT family acetyltransferase
MEIEHDDIARRFFVEFPDGQSELTYGETSPGVVNFWHTETSPNLRGRGLAGRVTETAMLWARANNLTVIAGCPYVAGWLRRHPDYADLESR